MLIYRILAYKDGRAYTGVCLDLDIIEEGYSSLEEARLNLQEAVEAYLQSVLESGISPEELRSLLYRAAPPEYWEKAKQFTSIKPKGGQVPQVPPFLYLTIQVPEPKHQLIHA